MKPQLNINNLWQGWLGRQTLAVRRAREEETILRQQMEAARREWDAAEHYFQAVVDPELVDHAIYTVEAAKRKYLYLYRRLRQAKGESLNQEESPWI